MKKLIIIFLQLLLLGGISQAQEPAVTDAPAAQTKRTSKFQGLWQQRKGHSLYFDYGYQIDLLEYSSYLKYKPLRFDLSYQYDIPWNPKRINFYAHAGLAYRQLNIDYNTSVYAYYEGPVAVLTDFEEGWCGYAGIGIKIHCTDWLHLSFSEAFNVMHGLGSGTFIGDGAHAAITPGWKHTFVGSQFAFRIVGEFKGFSLYAGYRLDHWIKTFPNHSPCVPSPYIFISDKNGHYEDYLTVGVGYTF